MNMKASIRSVLRPSFTPFTTHTLLSHHRNPFSKSLPSRFVQIRAFQLPKLTTLPDENSVSDKKTLSESEPSSPIDSTPGAVKLVTPLSKENLLPEEKVASNLYFRKTHIGKNTVLKETVASDLYYVKTCLRKESSSVQVYDFRLQQLIKPLLMEHGGNWLLTANGLGLERIFKFKGFDNTWRFMKKVAAKSKIERHHPEWCNIYNILFIRWTTHDPPGLTDTDILMAKYCDLLAPSHHERSVPPQDQFPLFKVFDEMIQSTKYPPSVPSASSASHTHTHTSSVNNENIPLIINNFRTLNKMPEPPMLNKYSKEKLRRQSNREMKAGKKPEMVMESSVLLKWKEENGMRTRTREEKEKREENKPENENENENENEDI
ncbi:pterin-4-alpha-carbinolamine dehydratase family protein [Sclerotinia borealis F-4128]|uniref:4a-hydroxytetrahydrobiopterin dehydratase n=1 Tax=Sclerotinia borealis (strain F-4128) TaxID=1432307 RepID=W9CE96_SCLBF|nr:pterin-4-alpha-carbinolamine dehydratase family protein [Sclerotinia borealis F-4128]